MKIINFVELNATYNVFYLQKFKQPTCLSRTRASAHDTIKRAFKCYIVDFIFQHTGTNEESGTSVFLVWSLTDA